MKIPIALVPLAQVAQIVLPYDPSTAPAPTQDEANGISFNLFVGIGLACLAILVLFALAFKKRSHHRR